MPHAIIKVMKFREATFGLPCLHAGQLHVSWSNWNLEMLVFHKKKLLLCSECHYLISKYKIKGIAGVL